MCSLPVKYWRRADILSMNWATVTLNSGTAPQEAGMGRANWR